VGSRYSREEMDQIKTLIMHDLSNREIASKLRRSEAGIRNIRYRLNLKRKTRDELESLRNMKEKLEGEMTELGQIKTELVNNIQSLEEKKKHYENLLNQDEESMRRKFEDGLIKLKLEKPELFYITGVEQIVILVGHLLKQIVS